MSESSGAVVGAIAVAFVVVLLGAIFLGYPMYNVWASQKSGEADLAHADYNRKITVVEAQQKNEAATYLAQAEITRAKGVAQANQIIGDSLKGNPEYLDYLWLTEKIAASDKEVIYVPTETQLPILEATRLSKAGEAKAA